ncbi:hypothetical protein ABN028_19735 [Actinopolymorpha sp. B17G11]|uniref:hypothetical protein n=1 Tax=Actinopolymorpha sp. B17G11 TaxID=3160861 RepID=UPI0032E48E0A
MKPDGAPPYPEYEQLLAEARSRDTGFVDPARLRDVEQLVWRRGYDWCCSVLGKAPDRRTWRESLLLLAADRANIDPPLPAAIVEAREERARWEAEVEARRNAVLERDAARWAEARTGCTVDLEVRPNTKGRRYGTGYAVGALCHAVPVTNALSGSARRPRLHRAGRPLCETPNKARPVVLGEPTDQPATCVACLNRTPHIRPEEQDR